MADITSSVAPTPVERSLECLGRWVCKKITPVADGVSAVATHTIITTPANSFIADGFLVFTTSMTSTGTNGTMKIEIGGVAYHATVTMDGTECVAGDVLNLSATDIEDSAGQALYKTSADTVDLTIATNAITAGAFYVIVRIVTLIAE